MRIILITIMSIFLFSSTLSAKYLDDTLTDIFSKIKKTFTYYGEVVAVIPNRNEAVVQFKNYTPKKGIEVIVYREKGPITNQLTGKIIGHIEDMIGLISLKESTGTVALGDIIENKGIRAGDKVKYSKRVVFKLKGIENLSDKPIQAYNIKSYLELAISNFPEFDIITDNMPLKNTKDIYVVNLKVFVKDSNNPNSKRISLKIYSSYTNFSIGLFNGDFTLSKKMAEYKQGPVASGTSTTMQAAPISNTGIPMYPMGPQAQMQQPGKYPQYPGYPGIQPNVRQTPAKYPYAANYANAPEKAAPQTNSKYNFDTFDKLKPTVTKFRKITQLSEKVKTIDFNKNKVVYSDGESIIYGEIKNDKFSKLSGDLYKGFGTIISVQFVDVDNDNIKDIVLNIMLKERMDSRIYKIKNNRMVIVGDHFDFIFGSYDFNNDGKEEFAGQTFDDENIFGNQLYKLKFSNGNIEKIKKTWIPFGFRLLTATKADLDGDGVLELLFINEVHRLMVYKKGEKIYTGEDSLGGTFNTATVNLGTEKFEYTKARAIDVKPVKFIKNNKGKTGVLIVHNYATLDKVLGDMGLFKEGEIKLVYMNDFGDVSIKTYTGKLEGGIEGFELYNNEIICAVIKKSAVNPLAVKAASYIVAFPAFK